MSAGFRNDRKMTPFRQAETSLRFRVGFELGMAEIRFRLNSEQL